MDHRRSLKDIHFVTIDRRLSPEETTTLRRQWDARYYGSPVLLTVGLPSLKGSKVNKAMNPWLKGLLLTVGGAALTALLQYLSGTTTNDVVGMF